MRVSGYTVIGIARDIIEEEVYDDDIEVWFGVVSKFWYPQFTL